MLHLVDDKLNANNFCCFLVFIVLLFHLLRSPALFNSLVCRLSDCFIFNVPLKLAIKSVSFDVVITKGIISIVDEIWFYVWYALVHLMRLTNAWIVGVENCCSTFLCSRSEWISHFIVIIRYFLVFLFDLSWKMNNKLNRFRCV